MLTDVQIQGVTAYPLADLAGAYEDSLARSVGVEDLVGIAARITDKYRTDGYFLTRAAVAPHDGRDGSATVVVYEGYISEVVVSGDGADAVRPRLLSLQGRGPLGIYELDRALALASDTPGVTLTSRIEPVLGDPAQHRLVIEAGLKRFAGGVYVENRGSDAQGPVQAYLTSSGNSLFAPGDQLTLSTLTTPERIDELTFAEVAYSTPAGDGRRLRLALSGYTTDAPPATTNGWLSGRSSAVSVYMSHPLVRSKRQSLWLNTGVDVRHVEQTYAGTGAADENLTVARVSMSGRRTIEGGYLSGTLQVSQGLDAFGATARNAPNLTRSDADGIFTKVNLGISGYRDIGRYAGIYGQAGAQWSDDPLLNSEEFSVGGSTFGRAYNYGEISGDRAIAGMAELRFGWDPAPQSVRFLQMFLFYDAATVSNLGVGGDRSDEMSSAGMGLRLTLEGDTMLKLELARPLDRTPYTEPDRDWRTFLSLSREL
ncbi:MAG: ShlB/FhaC/HecB family hemolysin secretion/activation protein [Pseudomonadota bacterium]|nr:ShlB/FhaC/HecB family hemolysin secretion/activation protein [Pseudomonadota bacterium]